MADDIVQRLNHAGDRALPGEPCGLLYDAAKEIERLRTLVASHESLLIRSHEAMCSAMVLLAPAPPPDELDGYDMLEPYVNEDDE
jgi:hypothetical protein